MLIIGIVVVAVVVVVVVGLVTAKKRRDHPSEDASTEVNRVNLAMTRIDPGPMMEVMPLPDDFTDEPAAEGADYDATDDLLDPRNPQHRQWVSEHPDDATNVDLDEGDTGPTRTSS